MDSPDHLEKLERYNINKKSAIGTLMLAIFVDVLGYSMIIPLLPSIAQGIFGASNFLVGIIISSNALTGLISAPIWGKLSDKYGRKPTFILAQFGTLASFLLLGFSNSLSMVFFSRVLDGIFGGQIPILRAYVVDITETKNRSGELARITGAMAFGMVFGPAIGGLAGGIDWRYPSFIASVLCVIAIVLAIRKLNESMPKQRRDDIKARKLQNKANNIHSKPVLTNKEVLFRLLQMFLIIFAFIMINSSFPLVLGLRYGLNVTMIGILASLAGIVNLISGLTTRKLIKTHGEKVLILFGLVLMTITFVGYPFLYFAWLLLIFIFPYAFSSLVIRTIIIANISKAVDEDQQGEASGWGTNMQAIAQVLAPIIAYGYLEIEFITIGSIVLDAYFLIGMTCTIATIALLILVLYDIKQNPDVFKKQSS